MGVSGSGKSTIGKALSEVMEIPFYDGDDFHPAENRQKMGSGIPLTDEDRWPWLQAINGHARKQESGIYACSALKVGYREMLMVGIQERSVWIFLKGNFELISSRMKKRKNHFMPPGLLQSQFDTLEVPLYARHIQIEKPVNQIVNKIQEYVSGVKKDLGIIGLGVMGRSLARNMGRNGLSLALYNRRVPGKEENIAAGLIDSYDELQKASGYEDLQLFIGDIVKPRRILLMVTAGAMEEVLETLIPLLDPNDMIIDGGNSDYKLTNLREAYLKKADIRYIGMGVSGGEKGALLGPAMMPGGTQSAYDDMSDIFDSIAAKNKNGEACVKWIGPEGSGHFVKMIHNGIEYAEMQLLAECYDIMKLGIGYDNDQIADVLHDWNQGPLQSYLLEISGHIFTKKKGDLHIIDLILDQASNKGTGAWASIAGIELGIPFNIISSALYGRYTSSYKQKREAIAKIYSKTKDGDDISIGIDDLRQAYQVARLLNHLQGLEYILAASNKHKWNINIADVAQVWTGGCIIRSTLMSDFAERFKVDQTLMQDNYWHQDIQNQVFYLKEICSKALLKEIPIPSFTACLNYFLAMKQSTSSANLIQAQRDYFGAHGFRYRDNPNGDLNHYNWHSE